MAHRNDDVTSEDPESAVILFSKKHMGLIFTTSLLPADLPSDQATNDDLVLTLSRRLTYFYWLRPNELSFKILGAHHHLTNQALSDLNTTLRMYG